jgi:mercuric ion binding protein
MKHLFVSIAAAIAVVAINSPARAAPQTVTLAVPTMDCPVCPITVKKALTKVPGVSEARVDFAKREAVVTFDDARASVQKLTQATENAGYPSSVKH